MHWKALSSLSQLLGVNADFSGPVSTMVTFLASDGPATTRNTTFIITDDNITEPNETILISGSSLSTFGMFSENGDTATITIIDNGEYVLGVYVHTGYVIMVLTELPSFLG